MEEILKYFDWVALIMASVSSALALAVINQTQGGQKLHNAVIAPIVSVVFTVLLIDWTGFLSHWQSSIFQGILTVMVATLFSVTKGQEITDTFIGFIADKSGIKKKDESGQS